MPRENVHEAWSEGYLVIVLCAVAAAISAALYNPVRGWFEQRNRAGLAQSQSQPLLDVKMQGQFLHVVLNRQASILKEAGSGMLSIRDGLRQQSISLSAQQLREAQGVIYSPSSAEVDVQLEISGPNIQKQTQSILFVLGRVQAAPASEQPRVADERPPMDAKVVNNGVSERPLHAPPQLTPLVSIKQQFGQSIDSANYIRPSPLNEIRPVVPAQLEPRPDRNRRESDN